MNLLYPNTIIDIGANKGDWSRNFVLFSPDADFHFIEPQGQHIKGLEDLAASFTSAKVHCALLGVEDDAIVPFYIVMTKDAPGSSMYKENTEFPMYEDVRHTRRLDTLLDASNLRRPIMMKIDVQGAELDVLKGAPQVLALTDMLCVELSFLEYNIGAPLAHDVITYLAERDFVLYDIEENFRRVDKTLAQVDAVFVRRDSVLREPQTFWGESAK